jgi:ABC-type branched-subunit amino acid transport system ATPase component
VQAETGCAIVIIEHNMALLASMCDVMVALDLGAVIATGSPTEVLADPGVVASYLGSEHAKNEVPRGGWLRGSEPLSSRRP